MSKKQNKIHKSQISPETLRIIEEKKKADSQNKGKAPAKQKPKAKKKKKSKKVRIRRIAILLIVVLIVGIFGNSLMGKLKTGEMLKVNFLVEPETQLDYNVVESDYLYLYNIDEGKMTAGHNENKKMYPASLTKMMTAIVTIEKAGDPEKLNNIIEMPSSIIAEMANANASVAGFAPGEDISYMDLLYGLMLPSGGDACMAIADKMFGSESEIVRAMNNKAEELNLSNTHFVNPVGLHDDDHYSTPKDMGKILEYGLKNPVFKKVISSFEYTTSQTAEHPEGIPLESTIAGKIETTENIEDQYGSLLPEYPINDSDKNLDPNSSKQLSDYAKYIKGGKSGYTEEANLCLATYGQIDGKNYLLITGKAPGDTHDEPLNMYDALYAYGKVHQAHIDQKDYINEKQWRKWYYKAFGE